MKVLRRLCDAALFWLALGAAVLTSWVVVTWPSGQVRPDAAMPGPLQALEYRGPSAKELVERIGRIYPEAISPPDAVE